MANIREVATITSKGQITLPKSIRQLLGVDYGGKVAFNLEGSRVLVTRADEPEHEDPAIAGFLGLLEADIRNGRALATLSDELRQTLEANLSEAIDLAADIEGDVAL